MYFYVGVFIFCTLMLIINNLLKSEKEKQIFEIVTLIVLCIISGTRYYLGGTDYLIYKNMFDALPNIENFDFSTVHNIYETFGTEKGYLFFCSIIKTIGFNFFGFTLIHSIIFYTCMYIGLKRYTNNFNLLIIVFLYKMFFYNTFISLRQSITIAIFFISIVFIERKKIIPYFLCCILAVTIHNGALLLFVVYFINKVKLTKNMLIILNSIFILTLIISIFEIPILTLFKGFINIFSNDVSIQKAIDLINGNAMTSINLLHTIEYFAIMFLIIKNYSKIIEQNEQAEFIIKIFLILLPLFTMFRGYGILTREKDYFLFTYPIILGYICQLYKKKYNFIIQGIVVAICLFGFCRFIILFDNGAMMPYESYLTKNISIFEKNNELGEI